MVDVESRRIGKVITYGIISPVGSDVTVVCREKFEGPGWRGGREEAKRGNGNWGNCKLHCSDVVLKQTDGWWSFQRLIEVDDGKMVRIYWMQNIIDKWERRFFISSKTTSLGPINLKKTLRSLRSVDVNSMSLSASIDVKPAINPAAQDIQTATIPVKISSGSIDLKADNRLPSCHRCYISRRIVSWPISQPRKSTDLQCGWHSVSPDLQCGWYALVFQSEI